MLILTSFGCLREILLRHGQDFLAVGQLWRLLGARGRYVSLLLQLLRSEMAEVLLTLAILRRLLVHLQRI